MTGMQPDTTLTCATALTGVATLRYDWTPFPTPRLNLTNAADLLAAPLSLQVE